jgi:hypothetical protein
MLKFRNHLFLLLFFSLLGVVEAQESPAPLKPLAVTEPRNAAVGFALTQTAFTVNMVGACKQMPEKTSQDPDAVLVAWRQRNGSIVDASQGWILYVRSLIVAQQGQEAGEAFTSKTLAEFATNGASTANSMFSKGDTKSVVCEKWLRFLSDPRIDLSASAEFGRDLNDILAFHTTVVAGASAR